MSDVDGGAPAPAENAPLPVADDVAAPPLPLSDNPPPAEPKAPEKDKEAEPTPRNAIERAKDAIEKREKAEGEPAKPVKSDATRDENGKFSLKESKAEPKPAEEPAKAAEKPADAEPAKGEPSPAAKPQVPAIAAPARFSMDAKAAWATAPDPVKSEVNRAIKEMEAGIEKHRASSDAYESVREFDEIAKKNGGNLRNSLERVVEIERAFATDPLNGLQKVADHFGLNLRAVAAHIMGQSPDQVQQQQDGVIASLNQKIARLEQQVGSVSKTFEAQQENAVLSIVSAFAEKNPRMSDEAFAQDMAFFLSSGRVSDTLPQSQRLSEAYALAERLNPLAATSNPEPEPVAKIALAQPDLVAQTLKGSKSLSGAPGTGSNPAARAPSSSIKDALRAAAARAG